MRETAEGMEYDCPECGGVIQIGWKMAVSWTCPHCHELTQVPWPDDETE